MVLPLRAFKQEIQQGVLFRHFRPSGFAQYAQAKTVMEGEPTVVKLANTWIIINVGGGPTDDKPDVVLETRKDPNTVDMFLNLRVADIQACYADWKSKGAEFLTEPKDHEREWRCYLRDPDGYVIEVGQFKL